MEKKGLSPFPVKAELGLGAPRGWHSRGYPLYLDSPLPVRGHTS